MSKEYYSRVHTGDYELVFQTDEKKAYTDVETYVRIVIDGKSAIPVDWLKAKAKKWASRNDVLMWGQCVKLLIEDWEKENECRGTD